MKNKTPKNHSPQSNLSVPLKETEDTPSIVSRRQLESEGTFNLSDKINSGWMPKQEGHIFVKDVKTFIQKRNRLDMMRRNREITWQKYIDRRNDLAGEELSK